MKTIIASMLITGATVWSLGNIYEAAVERVTEDDSDWSCVDDGNRICGPSNTEGKPAACYDVGGVIEMQWPCHRTANG